MKCAGSISSPARNNLSIRFLLGGSSSRGRIRDKDPRGDIERRRRQGSWDSPGTVFTAGDDVSTFLLTDSIDKRVYARNADLLRSLGHLV
jgi:hypothetical protein